MKNKIEQKMRNIIIQKFEKIPNLKEGYCLPPRWFFHNDVINLSDMEKNILYSEFDKLEKEGYINISGNDLNAIISITNKGIEYILMEKYKEDEQQKQSTIHSINAHNVQVGNGNTIIDISSKEFLSILKTLSFKEDNEKKEIFGKLQNSIENDDNILNLIIKIKEIFD